MSNRRERFGQAADHLLLWQMRARAGSLSIRTSTSPEWKKKRTRMQPPKAGIQTRDRTRAN